MQLIKHEDAPVLPGQPFVVATLPLPPSINRSYKKVTVPKKETAYAPSAFKNGKRVYSFNGQREMVDRLGATKELQQFKKDAAAYLCSLDCASFNYAVVANIRTAANLPKPIHIPLKFVVRFYYASLWKRDIDGGIKAVQDAVFKHLDLNDNLVKRLWVDKDIDAKNPRVEVELSILEED